AEDASLPVYPTMASQFNDEGVNRLFAKLVELTNGRFNSGWTPPNLNKTAPAEDLHVQSLIPGSRQRYLSDIADAIRSYHRWAAEQSDIAHKWQAVSTTAEMLDDGHGAAEELGKLAEQHFDKLDAVSK